MSDPTVVPPVHFYLATGPTMAERILCGDLDSGVLNTHVTEFGNQVTCEACRTILRTAADAEVDVRDPWNDHD